MKILRSVLVGLATAAMAASISAQSIEFLVVEWQRQTVQTSASNIVDATSTPFNFGVFIDGSAMTSGTFTSASFTNPGGVGGLVTFDTDNNEWKFESTLYDTIGNLTAAYTTNHSNPYTIDLTATSGSINGVSTPTTVTFPVISVADLAAVNVAEPTMTLNNGTWQPNGTFLVTDVNSPISISFNDVYNTTPGGSDSYHFDASIWQSAGVGNDNVSLTGGVTEGFVNFDPTTVNSPAAPLSISALTIAGGDLIQGNTYTLEVGYELIMDADGSVLGSTATAAYLAGIRTRITLVTALAAVPEPSTYALLGGLVVLIGTVVVRRGRLTRVKKQMV